VLAAWGDPTFRMRDKIFAIEKRGDGRISLWCTAPAGSQMVLVGADPERFFVPPYVGHKGWIGVRLDDEPDWDEVAAIVRRTTPQGTTWRSLEPNLTAHAPLQADDMPTLISAGCHSATPRMPKSSLTACARRVWSNDRLGST
jgi:hypothetical protein